MPSVSAKQARLMSAIKHGWHPPAGMHAPSLAVAREFHAADKQAGKYMHAEGGKVGNLSALAKKLTAMDVVKSILGDKVTASLDDLNPPKSTPYMATRTWGSGPMFVGFDNPSSGTIGLRHLGATDPRDLAEAAHETSHAVLHEFGHKQPHDEDLVNRIAHRWLLEHLPEEDVPTALARIKTSQISYGMEPSGLPSPEQVLARKASQLDDRGYDPYNSADAYAKKAAAQAAADEILPGLVDQTHWADGGSVRPWRHRDGTPYEGQSVDANPFLQLVAHAADRATSTVTDDPHHVLARVASGLASQVAGRSPSGRLEFGRLPNIVNEVKSLPAGLTDVGMAGSNILGALANKYLPKEPGSLGDILPRLAQSTNAYAAKHGDPAPDWSRRAEEEANATHQAANKAMGLAPPHGVAENTADALGVMLGQLPIPLAETKTVTRGVRGGLSALGRAIPEYLGPTIRPSLRNYATGALGGGALGALSDSGTPPPVVDATYGPAGKFE